MKHTLFITGTDTDVGKTYISVELLKYWTKKSYKTIGLKPIASGCRYDEKEARLVNQDALQLQQAAAIKLPYEQVNPFALHHPIAPHLAAKAMNKSLTIKNLHKKTALVLSMSFDICLIEGAGGWLLPLNEKETYADYVLYHDMNIILVVGMRLGCINHALLTCQSILQRHGKLMGWIANSPSNPMPYFNENLETLVQLLPVPHLGTVMSQAIFSPMIHPPKKRHAHYHQRDAIINNLFD